MAAILIALLLNTIVSISMTGLSVSDSDPTTYVIVVLLMLFLFLLFYLKDKSIVPRPTRKTILSGSLILLAYVLVTAYARVWLSYLFLSYSVNALLLPVFLAAAIVAVFGFSGLRKMKMALIYSLFASPIILLPVLNLNGQFALFNAYVIYDMARAVGLPLLQSGIVITAPSNYAISISTTCADIGAFVAFVMFIAPLTYLFDGRASRKLLWAVAGVALLFLMNIVRMFSIVLLWLYYGIGSAISTFHLFAGEVLFSLAIVVMILLAYKFGLRMPAAGKASGSRKSAQRRTPAMAYAVLVPCVAFGVIALLLSLAYPGAVYMHPLPNNQTVPNYPMLDRHVILSLESARLNITQLPNVNSSLAFALGSSADPSMETYVLVGYTQNLQYPAIALPGQTHSSAVVLDNGVTLLSAFVNSSGSTFAVDYFSVPYNASGQPSGLTYEFVRKVYGPLPQCAISVGPVGYLESAIYNAFNLRATDYSAIMCESYMVANSIGT